MMSIKGWKKVNTWRFKGPLLAVASLLGLFDHRLHWGGLSVTAGIAIVIPIIGFLDFWRKWKFWSMITAIAILQVPLVLALRPFVDGFPLFFAFGILDCGLIISGISLVCGNDADDVRRGVGES